LSEADTLRLRETSYGSKDNKNLIVGRKIERAHELMIRAIDAKIIDGKTVENACKSVQSGPWHENLIRLLGGFYYMSSTRSWWAVDAKLAPEFTEYARSEVGKLGVDISQARRLVANILTNATDSKHIAQPTPGTTRVPDALKRGVTIDDAVPMDDIEDELMSQHWAEATARQTLNSSTQAGVQATISSVKPEKNQPPPSPQPQHQQQQQQTGAGKTAPPLSAATSFASAAVSNAVAAAASVAAPITSTSSSILTSQAWKDAPAPASVVPNRNLPIWTMARTSLVTASQTPAEVLGQAARAKRQASKELKRDGKVSDATQIRVQQSTENLNCAFVGSSVVRRSDGVWCPARGSTDPLPKAQYLNNALQLPAKIDGKEGQQMCTAFMWVEKNAIADRNVYVAIRRTNFIEACNVGKTSGSKEAEKITPIYVQCNVGSNEEVQYLPACVIKLECDTINMMFPRSSNAVVRDMINTTTQQINNLIFRFGLAFAEDRATRAQQRGRSQPSPMFRAPAQLASGAEDAEVAAKLRDLLDINGS